MKIFSIIFLLFVLIACRTESINCGLECSYEEEQLFQTGFNGMSLTNADYGKVDITGVDNEFATLNSWDEFQNHPSIGTVRLSYEDGDDSQRLASVVDDPELSGNNVLKFQIIEPHIKEGGKYKGRVQMNVAKNQCIKEIYQTIKIRLHPDMAYLSAWDKRVYWLSIFEFWNNADWSKEKFPFRVTVNLFKDNAEAGSPLRFHVKSDYKKNCKNCKWHKSWEEEATNFDIPFGEWMEIELYLKEGDENNGRFYMAVTPDGDSKIELFNITNNTQHPKEKCADGFTHFQPLKFYTSDELINYMKDGGKELSIYWDDWKLYKNKSF